MCMHKKFLNTFKKLREEVGEDRDSFMQKALKVCKTFKVKSLKTPKLDKLPTKTACILFYIYMEGKKELNAAAVFERSANLSGESEIL